MAASKTPTRSTKKPAARTTAAKSPAAPRKTPSAKADAPATPVLQVVAPMADPVTDPVADPAPAAAPLAEAAVAEATTLKLKDLVDRVTKATGAKKKAVKQIVESTLHHLGDALWSGHHLNLPPLGKAKVGRHKDKAGSEMLMVKLHRGGGKGGGKKDPKQPLAEVEE